MNTAEGLIELVKQGDTEGVRRILEQFPALTGYRDGSGATPLHYAALHGHREIVRLFVEHGADINATDTQFGATPSGWAIEYLREFGGYLAIELNDLSHAIRQRDAKWAGRFLGRFPGLRSASSTGGIPFRTLAREGGDPDILALFE